MGTLYVVATPIGNLEDLSPRALRVLRQVGLVAAEDTRTTAKLLARYNISTPMVSFFEHNELTRLDEILHTLETGDVALVSEAGMPTISDPGFRLVRAAIDAGLQVLPVPGPSAVLAALAVSGLPTDQFTFLGFPPRRAAARRQFIAAAQDVRHTLVLFEAPHRLADTLRDLLHVLGDRQVAVACELTKMFEQVWRGSLSAAVEHYRQVEPRGEFTLVVTGASTPEQEAWDEEQVRQGLRDLIGHGASRRDAAREIAALAGWPRRTVYELALQDD